MKTAIGYIRVSTAGQVDEGVSLDAQRAKIEAWCLLNDYERGSKPKPQKFWNTLKYNSLS